MDGNETAMALYRSLGMTVSRRLDCYEIAHHRRPPPPVFIEIVARELDRDSLRCRFPEGLDTELAKR